MSSFAEKVLERGEQRAKYLEDPNYRRLSDVFTLSTEYDSNYVSKIDISMLACYLVGSTSARKENVTNIIEANLTNPEINWRGLFAYLDERYECQRGTRFDILQKEFVDLHMALNPYRDIVCPKSTFIGF